MKEKEARAEIREIRNKDKSLTRVSVSQELGRMKAMRTEDRRQKVLETVIAPAYLC
jgi:hypothetical protein